MQNRKLKNLTKKSVSGFTLLELVTVIVIIFTVLSICVFSYSRFLVNTVLDTAASELVSTCRLAREMAISLNSTHRVTLELANPKNAGRQCYWIDRYLQDTLGNFYWQTQVTTPQWVPDKVIITDVSGVETDYDFIVFTPYGTASTFYNIHLTLREADRKDTTKFYTVSIFPSTGVAKIYPYEKR